MSDKTLQKTMKIPYLTIAALAVASIAFNAISNSNSINAETIRVETVVETVAETEGNMLRRESNHKEVKLDKTEEIKPKYISPYNFSELKNQNQDIVGWVKIEGSSIDYPILFNGTDDYLHKNINGEWTAAGSIYVDANADPKSMLNDKINIVYGHNMKNGSMFKDIDRYNNESFWNEHQEIMVYTEGFEKKLTPMFVCYGIADEALRDIDSIESLQNFVSQKSITNGEIPEKLDELYVFVTCNYNGNDFRTYLFCQ